MLVYCCTVALLHCCTTTTTRTLNPKPQTATAASDRYSKKCCAHTTDPRSSWTGRSWPTSQAQSTCFAPTLFGSFRFLEPGSKVRFGAPHSGVQCSGFWGCSFRFHGRVAQGLDPGCSFHVAGCMCCVGFPLKAHYSTLMDPF